MSTGFSELLVITKKDFLMVLNEFPDTFEEFREVARKRAVRNA